MTRENFLGDKENNHEFELTNEGIFSMIGSSKIKGIKKHKNKIAAYILTSDNPSRSYQEVKSFLSEESLPTAELAMFTFRVLFGKGVIERGLKSILGVPLMLRQLSEIEREDGYVKIKNIDKFYEIIHRDLLNISLHSNNVTLKSFFSRDDGDDRLSSEMLQVLGVSSYEEVLVEMEKTVKNAHLRGLQIADNIRRKTFKFEKGGLVRGVNSKNLSLLLQNGDLSYEYHGWESFMDRYTPFDLDVFQIGKTTKGTDFFDEDDKGAVTERCPWYYGDMVLYIRDRGQWSNPVEMELSNTSSLSDRHLGVRTGIPSSQIDLMVWSPANVQAHSPGYNLYKEEIVGALNINSWYIPVVDENLDLIYTPEMYDEAQKVK